MAKFCTRCGKQCSEHDLICPACGQMLSSGGMVMKQTQSQASKSKVWIIIAVVMIIIVGLFVIASLAGRFLGVGGVSRQQSDADVAMLSGEYTYNRTEKVNDSIIDVFYKVDAQKELLDYTYECQLRYVKMKSGWELTEKEMKLLDYEWKLAGTTWESEENGTYGNTKKYSFHIKSISKDDITVQYLIQDIRTNEIEQGETRTHLDKLTELAYIYIEDDGLIAGGYIDIESEEIPIHFAINFSEMCICYSKNLMLGFGTMTKVEREGALFDTSPSGLVEEEVNEDVDGDTIQSNSSEQTEHYRQYFNARFGYSMIVPNSFIEDTSYNMVSDNGDGMCYNSEDGQGRITISGQYNVESETAQERLERYSDIDGYKYAGENYYVMSFVEDDSIIYSAYHVDDELIYGFELIYDETQQERFDPIIATMLEYIQSGEGNP